MAVASQKLYRCYKCKKSKPRSEFYRARRQHQGRTGYCKPCAKQKSRQRYHGCPDSHGKPRAQYSTKNGWISLCVDCIQKRIDMTGEQIGRPKPKYLEDGAEIARHWKRYMKHIQNRSDQNPGIREATRWSSFSEWATWISWLPSHW